jgi:hypothetical protein
VTKKLYLSANQVLEDSFELGTHILTKDFKPDLVIGVWRGGASVAIAIHELLTRAGINSDHFPVRTQLYSGIGQRRAEVEIEGLDYFTRHYEQFNKVLLVDDIFDSGQTMVALKNKILEISKGKLSELRIATIWYKPSNNESDLKPDFFLRSTESWLVFPHELCGIEKDELLSNKPGIDKIKGFL